jgi:hypothetical protein
MISAAPLSLEEATEQLEDMIDRGEAFARVEDAIYQRILAHNPRIAGHAANYAVTAVSASNLSHQATLAANQGAELVTVDIGINDACAPLGSNRGQQTPLDVFNDEFRQPIGILAAAASHPRILVASIPNPYRTWSLFHNDPKRAGAVAVRGHLSTIADQPDLDSARRRPAPRYVSGPHRSVQPDRAAHLQPDPELSNRPRGAVAWLFGTNDIATVANTGGVDALPSTFQSSRPSARELFLIRPETHAVELAREGVPLPVIQRQLGHSYVSPTSVYLQGIDVEKIMGTIHARRAPAAACRLGRAASRRCLRRVRPGLRAVRHCARLGPSEAPLARSRRSIDELALLIVRWRPVSMQYHHIPSTVVNCSRLLYRWRLH